MGQLAGFEPADYPPISGGGLEHRKVPRVDGKSDHSTTMTRKSWQSYDMGHCMGFCLQRQM